MKTVNLNNYFFPVEEREVLVAKPGHGIIDLQNRDTYSKPANKKALVRTDTDEVISVVNDTYKTITNKQVIETAIQDIERLNYRYIIDPSHSWVESNRMRLQITFPELIIKENGSDIAFSIFLHNSYDGSEGVRSIMGAIRSVCTNGMVFGDVLGKFYRRHTSGFSIGELENVVKLAIADVIPNAQRRIKALQSEAVRVNKAYKENVLEKNFGKRFTKKILEEGKAEGMKQTMSMWMLYNLATYVISHRIKKHLQFSYQQQVSKFFKL
ncbi:MAG: DUF932 domain-containing protein [Candidatus Lokiarchaeota archaeon]|nr:DUF932 domain-containing protein [Candidatus Lokiarchaeota archaeon]